MIVSILTAAAAAIVAYNQFDAAHNMDGMANLKNPRECLGMVGHWFVMSGAVGIGFTAFDSTLCSSAASCLIGGMALRVAFLQWTKHTGGKIA
jgi:hypothetical protein